eukprot:g2826.t1
MAGAGGGPAQGGGFDLVQAIRFYVDKIVSDPSMTGMKALILDSDTKKIVSMVYTQSQILEKEVYLVETLGNAHERMLHLKAAVFVRPTRANADLLKSEFGEPRFGEYHLFFSNIVPNGLLQELAMADEREVVRQVQEYYADVNTVGTNLFELGLPQSLMLCLPPVNAGEKDRVFRRHIDGLVSVMLALQRRPIVRYQAASALARQLAQETFNVMSSDPLFEFPRQESTPVLLIIDRRDDPVTPLLSQWTYEAMVHELIGIRDARVDLRGRPGVSEDLAEVVLSAGSDSFFAEHMHDNFGDVSAACKGALDAYQRDAKMNENISSIEDMQRFLERFPAFKAQAHQVSKHVALATELARLVEAQQLMDVSALEQDLSSTDAHGEQYADLMTKLQNPAILPRNKVRLVVLYALRYERNSGNKTALLKTVLRDNGVPAEEVRLVDAVLEYGGAGCRGGDLFGDKTMLAKFSRSVKQGLEGAVNVYSQHTTLLASVLKNLAVGKVKESQYPFVQDAKLRAGARDKVRDVIVFIAGGVTYEEKLACSEMSKQGMNVVVGGSCVQNSESFLAEVANVFGAGSS